jgi:CRISPR system Cascade subunit CasC
MLIELHLLQSFPVSNLNRDDIGQPKTARFGGCVRARISSQCLKKAARDKFTAFGLQETELGCRTKRLAEAAARILIDQGRDPGQAAEIARAGLESLGFGFKEDLTEYLLYVGASAAQTLAGYCERDWNQFAAAVDDKKKQAERQKNSKKPQESEADGESPEPEATRSRRKRKITLDKQATEEVRRVLDATRTADIALFGRMIASNTDFNVTGATQVAHAFSTHAVAAEFDYYTALDHLKATSEPGADMIGTIDFNAACYYRYANLDLAQLSHNLPDDPDLASRSAQAFLHAFINAIPGGKQHSMAAPTLPDTLLGVVRSADAWSLANAFLQPVADTGDIMATSAERLTHHFGQIRSFYGSGQIGHACYASVSGHAPGIADVHVTDSASAFVASLLAAAQE